MLDSMEARMRKALGRGLEALLPGGGPVELPATASTREEVALTEIRPNPPQPPRHLD